MDLILSLGMSRDRVAPILVRNSMDGGEQCLNLGVARFLTLTAIQQARDRAEHSLLLIERQRFDLCHLLGKHGLDFAGQVSKLLKGFSNLLVLFVR